jgi:nucleoid DNA-binding protein
MAAAYAQDQSHRRMEPTHLFLGAVVNNHKRHERELMPQYFKLRKKASRKGRNPQTGNEIEITARRVLTFKPSKGLKAQVNHR